MPYPTVAQVLDRADQAHAVLLKQPDLQFRLPPATPPEPPAWLAWLGRVLGPVLKPVGQALGPVAPYIFWGGLAFGVLTILYLVASNWFRLKPGAIPSRLALETADDWRPANDVARALLQDADRLAAEGLYEEAAHLILLRSIQDIEARRPRRLAPSLTSRDIAALEGLPPAARETFAGIALKVERSLFGGRPMGPEGFAACRAAYADLVGAEAWR